MKSTARTSDAIFTANADVKTAEGNVVAANTKLDDKYKLVKSLEAELATERGALLDLTVDWDSFYDVYVSTARLYCLTDQDAKGLGLPAAGLATYVLAPPISVTAVFDTKLSLLRIRVKRPAGLTAAYELVRLGVRPVVLEKSGTVGGIARTEQFKGFRFDMGGHRFFTKSAEVQAMSDDDLKKVITEGKGKMKPVASASASAADIVAYIRTWKK